MLDGLSQSLPPGYPPAPTPPTPPEKSRLPPLPPLPSTSEADSFNASIPPDVVSEEAQEVERSENNEGFWKTLGLTILKAGLVFGLIIGYAVLTGVALTLCWPLGFAMLNIAAIALGLGIFWTWLKIESACSLDPDEVISRAAHRGSDPI